MEALKMAAGSQIQRVENSLGKMKNGSAPCAGYGISTSAVECCAFRDSNQNQKQKKVCAPVGLAGDGLSGEMRRRRGRLSFSSASPSSPSSSSSCSSSSSSYPRSSRMSNLALPPRSTTAAAAAPTLISLQGESLLEYIVSQDLEAETPSLVQQCSDMDWKKLVDDLRSEALHGLQSEGLRASSLKALEKLMGSWIDEQMVDGLERPRAGRDITEPGWSFEAAAGDLRMEANLQAAQALAKGVDSTFDWETDVVELHERILLQGGAEPSVLRPEQHLLWQAWTDAQSQVAESSNQLAQEALASMPVNGDAESLNSEPQVEVVRRTMDVNANGSANGSVNGSANGSANGSVNGSANGSVNESANGSVNGSANGSVHGKSSLFTLGALVATSLAVEATWLVDAIAEEAPPAAFEAAVEAASRAPSWLVPTILVFPPLSYFIFNVYREKVNPYAKLTDWMFGVVAITIVANIITRAAWGVRLY